MNRGLAAVMQPGEKRKLAAGTATGGLGAERLLASIARVSQDAPATGAPLSVPAQALASAAFSSSGRLIIADPAFTDAFGLDLQLDAAPAPGAYRLLVQPCEDGSVAVMLIASPLAARGWPLSPTIAAVAGEARFVALTYRPFAHPNLVGRACEGWRLTSLETRVVSALLANDNLKVAARTAGVAYETAREAIAAALRKAGARRQADLVRRLHMAAGVGEFDLAEVGLFAPALGLPLRQAAVCRLVAMGLTRPEIAATLRVSEHVVKAELKRLFETLGVRTAGALSEVAVQASILLALAGADNLAHAAQADELRPLRLLSRPEGGGRIALSDYGPASGAPTFLMHSALTGSLIDRGLIKALQRRGLRPIAIERPGFGLTDPPPTGSESAAERAAADMALAAEALKLKRVRLLCRGGEAAALIFAEAHPQLFAGGVLLNPFRPYEVDTRWDGLMNMAKRMIAAQPHLIESIAAFLVRRASPRSMAGIVREAVKASPSDLAALEDQRILADYVASARLAALATPWGFIQEQSAYVGWRPPPMADGRAWTRLLGEQDVLYLPGEGDEVWDEALPGHRVIRIPEAGRLIHASHPEIVAEVVAGLT
ncbi:alpha/beta fold hydrolase [Phenylobacterium sp.]|uniref:alpha/beta fold hydrolase n=1 Tax=Phenylobacterium sp. TaxID=1871053 RepID=UPI00272F4F8F|nr:alpha/beta fold hydrolase [Phenylobacterium sp.]MDP1874945.1 alpha/beta fold hydrolase [Phenylobacterium sp.]